MNKITNRKRSGRSEFRDTRAGVDANIHEGLLLQEITHRINNDLASTIGFVAHTARQSNSDEVKIVLAGLMEHIHDFASVQRALQMPADDRHIDAAAYLRELCRTISRAKLQFRSIELVLQESALQLGASRCWRLGMIVSELIANSARHAFQRGGGRIDVALCGRSGLVECTVADNGSASYTVRPGQGSRILRALAADLRGSIDHRFSSNGTIVHLSFPLSEEEAEIMRAPKLGPRQIDEVDASHLHKIINPIQDRRNV